MKKTSIIFILIIIMIVGSIIRLYHLTDVPAGLLQDEAAMGYDAYSLALIGTDHHGAFLPISFQTFNDWMVHGFNYQLIPFVGLFGLNIFSVRFAVAFLSIWTIVLIYLLGKELTGNEIVSLLASFLFSLSNFSVVNSRWAVAPNTVAFSVTLGLYLFFFGLNRMEKRGIFWAFSAVGFGLAFYNHPSLEAFLPLFLLGSILIVFFMKKTHPDKKLISHSLLFLILFSIVALPLVVDHIRRPFTLTTRFNMVAAANYTANPFLSYIQNYLSYYLPTHLFLGGEVNPSRTVPGFGYENAFLGIFYYLGLIVLIFKKDYLTKTYSFFTRDKIDILCLFLLLFPVVPSLTVPPGDFQRATYILPIMIFLISIGLIAAFHLAQTLSLKYKKNYTTVFVICTISIYLYTQFIFYSCYFGDYYRGYVQWYFQYGLEEVVKFTSSNENKYRNIIIDSTINQPYIYILFYKKVDPRTLTEENYKDFSEIDPKTNWLAVKKYQRYRFKKVGEEDVKGGKLIKAIKNSPVSDYALYEKDGDLIVRFETKGSKSSKTRPDTVDYLVGIFSKFQL